MPFKFDGQFVFLTYPQANIEHAAVHLRLSAIGPVDWLRVCTERHADGNPHVHAVGKFSRRVQSRNERIFDIDGKHPCIERPRDTKRALQYIAKDGEFTDFGDVPSNQSKRSQSEALELAGGDEKEYLIACMEAKVPHQYAKRIRELTLASRLERNIIPSLYEALLQWECQALQQQTLPENKCAVLVGPSGCGKSAWAKRVAPKPALWVTHIDTLREFDPRIHKSIIFDDMSFTHMPLQAQIHLVDWVDDRTIHCRYGTAHIPKQTVKIFTCNDPPFVQHQAIDRRIELINLY